MAHYYRNRVTHGPANRLNRAGRRYEPASEEEAERLVRLRIIERVEMTPRAAAIIETEHVEIVNVKPTGKGGKVTAADVKAAVEHKPEGN